jgi:hypothetical protein
MNFVKIFILSILITYAFADDVNEKMKAKVVSRMYQSTYGILEICPDEEVDSFKKIIEKFEKTYPEFTKLLNESKYHQYAVDTMAGNIVRERKASEETRMSQCKFGKSITESLINTTDGEKSVNDMLAILKK